MCIIAVSKTRKMTEGELEACYINNHDGIGIAIAAKEENKKGILIFKTKSYVKACNFYNEHVIEDKHFKGFKCTPYVIHFRYGSSGLSKSLELAHPFIIDKFGTSPATKGLEFIEDPNIKLLFHNGTISDYRDKYMHMLYERETPEFWQHFPVTKENFSDTRVAALIAHHYGCQHLDILLSSTAQNKFVIVGVPSPKKEHIPAEVNVSDEPDMNIRFLDKSLWTEEEGIWYSNLDFQGFELLTENARQHLIKIGYYNEAE